MGYDSIEECEERAYNFIWWCMVIIIPFIFLIYLYFLVVVFTHWKNWKLPVSEGGCMPNPKSEKRALRKHADETA